MVPDRMATADDDEHGDDDDEPEDDDEAEDDYHAHEEYADDGEPAVFGAPEMGVDGASASHEYDGKQTLPIVPGAGRTRERWDERTGACRRADQTG